MVKKDIKIKNQNNWYIYGHNASGKSQFANLYYNESNYENVILINDQLEKEKLKKREIYDKNLNETKSKIDIIVQIVKDKFKNISNDKISINFFKSNFDITQLENIYSILISLDENKIKLPKIDSNKLNQTDVKDFFDKFDKSLVNMTTNKFLSDIKKLTETYDKIKKNNDIESKIKEDFKSPIEIIKEKLTSNEYKNISKNINDVTFLDSLLMENETINSFFNVLKSNKFYGSNYVPSLIDLYLYSILQNEQCNVWEQIHENLHLITEFIENENTIIEKTYDRVSNLNLQIGDVTYKFRLNESSTYHTIESIIEKKENITDELEKSISTGQKRTKELLELIVLALQSLKKNENVIIFDDIFNSIDYENIDKNINIIHKLIHFYCKQYKIQRPKFVYLSHNIEILQFFKIYNREYMEPIFQVSLFKVKNEESFELKPFLSDSLATSNSLLKMHIETEFSENPFIIDFLFLLLERHDYKNLDSGHYALFNVNDQRWNIKDKEYKFLFNNYKNINSRTLKKYIICILIRFKREKLKYETNETTLNDDKIIDLLISAKDEKEISDKFKQENLGKFEFKLNGNRDGYYPKSVSKPNDNFYLLITNAFMHNALDIINIINSYKLSTLEEHLKI